MKNIIILGLVILIGLLVALGINMTLLNSASADSTASSIPSNVGVLGMVLFINTATVGWLYSRKARQ